jgi:hypothetical protein
MEEVNELAVSVEETRVAGRQRVMVEELLLFMSVASLSHGFVLWRNSCLSQVPLSDAPPLVP